MKKTITVVGLGAGTIDQLPLGVYRFIKNSESPIYVRTLDHPVVETLQEEGIYFESFDYVYEKHEHFEEVYEEIVSFLVTKVSEEQQVVYAVPGHPMLAEKTVKLLLEREKEGLFTLEIAGGQSYLDSLFQSLKIDPIEGFQFVDATSFNRFELQYSHHLIFSQVYDDMIASDVKLTLLEDLPYDYPVTIVDGAGTDREKIITVPLYELDRTVELSNLCSIYVPPVPKELQNHQFHRLREVIATLRGPNGCPWDQKQTHESLKPYFLEEVYEVLEAIDEKDDDHLAEELGDVLLQIMLHSQIGEDHGYFSIDDVIKHITEKMIRRHPHVFAEASVSNEGELLKQWDAIKQQEKGDQQKESILDSIEKSLPSLLYAYKLQKKAAKVGFDWDDVSEMWEKLKEEMQEFKEAVQNKTSKDMEEELGDILFSIVNIARFYSINPEVSLLATNQKFKARFQYIEKQAQAKGLALSSMTLEEMDALWNEAKEQDETR